MCVSGVYQTQPRVLRVLTLSSLWMWAEDYLHFLDLILITLTSSLTLHNLCR